VVVNILGDSVEDYASLADKLNDIEGISAIEVNISCPNVKRGGVAFGADPVMVREVTRAVKEKSRLPVIIKLSPNVTDITVTARAAEEGGADAVSLINTLIGMAIDARTRQPRLANVIGGLSGPAIKPVALRMVWQTARAVTIPVIGIGGIMNTEDALEFLIAGATAVQIGTANFVNPDTTEKVVDGIAAYLRAGGCHSVREIIGSLRLP
jgi:dihydroorotate dehydrogenase (NAD+) catalytic subunit